MAGRRTGGRWEIQKIGGGGKKSFWEPVISGRCEMTKNKVC